MEEGLAEFLGRPCFGIGFRRERNRGGSWYRDTIYMSSMPDSGKGESVIWGESSLSSITQP